MISLLALPSQAALPNISFPIPFSKKIKSRVAPSVTRLKPQQVKQLACMVSAGAYHVEPMPRWCLKSYKSLYQVPDEIFIPNSCFFVSCVLQICTKIWYIIFIRGARALIRNDRIACAVSTHPNHSKKMQAM